MVPADQLPATRPPAAPDPAGALPVRALDRRAVERVLARAAELQGRTGEPDSDAIDEDRLVEIAREAGLSEAAVRQALAEERTRIEAGDDDTLLTRVAGPAVVSASRVVPGTVAAAVTALDAWMLQEECLVVQRRFTDRMVWEPRNDWLGALRRGLRLGGRHYQLARARQVSATVVPVQEGRVLVRLDADVSPARTVRLRLGAVAGVGGAALGGSLLAAGAVAHAAFLAALTAALLPAAVGGGAAYLALRKHRDFAARTALALEQVLDRLEHGDARRQPTLLDALVPPRALRR